MKTACLKAILSSSIILTTLGCSSGDPKTPVDDNSGGPVLSTEPADLMIRVERQSAQPVTSENAQNSVVDTARILFYLMNTHHDFIEPGGNVMIDAALAAESDQSEPCARGGTERHQMNAPAKVVEEGYRTFGPGDELIMSFSLCGSDLLTGDFYFNGVSGFKVITGFYDGFDATVNPTQYLAHYDHFSVSGLTGNNLIKYHNGTIRMTLTPNSQQLSSDDYAQIDIQPLHDVSFVLTDLEATISAYPKVNSWDETYQMTFARPLFIESDYTGNKLLVEIVQPLLLNAYSTPNIEAGSMIISGSSGHIGVRFYQGYLVYEVDADGDGAFEEQHTVFDAEY